MTMLMNLELSHVALKSMVKPYLYVVNVGNGLENKMDLRSKNEKLLANLNITIADNDGNLRDVDEIIAELQNLYDNYDTHSMNEYTLYLQGEKNMILKVIEYLKRI